MDVIYDRIIDAMQPSVLERFMELPGEIRQMYLRISGDYLDELIARDMIAPDTTVYILFSTVIGIHTSGRPPLQRWADPLVKRVARELTRRFNPIKKELKKLDRKRIREQKKQRKIIKKKMAKQAKDEGARAKKAVELLRLKKLNRTRNTICKNDIEFITQEDIEDIPTDELTHIKLEKSIYCLDKDSFKNMVKYSKDQKVRGACKPPVRGQPLDCKWFYPINIGQNVYISEENYKSLNMEKRKFVLKNKRIVDFTTGLHMMSEKSGKDAVYDLVAEDFSIAEIKKIIKKKIIKKKVEIKKITKSIKKLKLNVKQLKVECKKKGIKGYSKWKKAELEKRCLSSEQLKNQAKKKSQTVKELRAECKRKGIKGYSKMKKAELLKTCVGQNGGALKKKRSNHLKKKRSNHLKKKSRK